MPVVSLGLLIDCKRGNNIISREVEGYQSDFVSYFKRNARL